MSPQRPPPPWALSFIREPIARPKASALTPLGLFITAPPKASRKCGAHVTMAWPQNA